MVWNCVVSFRIVLYRFVLFVSCIVLYHFVLCCIILDCFVSFCVVLYHFGLCWPGGRPSLGFGSSFILILFFLLSQSGYN